MRIEGEAMLIKELKMGLWKWLSETRNGIEELMLDSPMSLEIGGAAGKTWVATKDQGNGHQEGAGEEAHIGSSALTHIVAR